MPNGRISKDDLNPNLVQKIENSGVKSVNGKTGDVVIETGLSESEKDALVNNYGVWSGDLNDIVKSGFYYALNSTTNSPNTSQAWHVQHMTYRSAYMVQTAYSANGSQTVLSRRKVNGTWDSWSKVLMQSDYDALFQQSSSGKEQVANAITAAGIDTSTTAEFATMATNIRKIKRFTRQSQQYNLVVPAFSSGQTFSPRNSLTFAKKLEGMNIQFNMWNSINGITHRLSFNVTVINGNTWIWLGNNTTSTIHNGVSYTMVSHGHSGINGNIANVNLDFSFGGNYTMAQTVTVDVTGWYT